MYDKAIKIEQGLDVSRALRAVAHFAHHYKESHPAATHPNIVIYDYGTIVPALMVYQTATLYVVRKAL